MEWIPTKYSGISVSLEGYVRGVRGAIIHGSVSPRGYVRVQTREGLVRVHELVCEGSPALPSQKIIPRVVRPLATSLTAGIGDASDY